MKLWIKALLLSLLLAACGGRNDTPKGILKPEKMKVVLWEVLQSDAFAFQFVAKDTTKKPVAEAAALQQQVFAAHKTTREVFYKSFEYYRKHPDKMGPLLDSMINEYTRDKYKYTKGTKDSTGGIKQAD